jgi:LysR family transcriptional regulator, nod-box dependent transcriptional activator
MRFNRLDLNLLVALDHLLHLRSVSGAAERLNMTQSAMSNALLRLRQYFDDDLLVKVGRRLELTPRGEALKDAVRDVLVRVEWTIATKSQFDPAHSDREFNILVSDYTLATLVPRILAQCQKVARHIRFNFLYQYDVPERLLDRGDVDLVIIPTEFCSRRHPSDVVLEEEFLGIVWKHGKLAQKKEISRRDFLEASHVVMQPGCGAQSLESMYFRQLGLVRQVDVTTYSFNTIPWLIVSTDRIATIHARLARQAEAMLPIKVVRLPFRLPRMRQSMQWHRYRSQDAGLVWLRAMIREAGMDSGHIGKARSPTSGRPRRIA